MTVKDMEFDFNILPAGSAVIAQIYMIDDYVTNQTILTHKEFGRWYRGRIKKDYDDARAWAEEQLEFIYHANKP